ncbi:MAG TPA: DUF455 family protein [Ktedonobacterales bacterium]|nr:DUF455 family protein [Ktedonobacterales bacterium]
MKTDSQVGICHPVEEAHWYMDRFHFLERRCMEALASWVWTTGDLDAKQLFGLHAYEDMMTADLFLQRTKELHPGVPTYGWEPKPLQLESLDALCREVARASTLGQKLLGLYGALKPWLLEQYAAYLQTADTILEGPSIRLLEQTIQQKQHQIADGLELAWEKLGGDAAAQADAEAWQARIKRLLTDAAALDGLISAPDAPLARFNGDRPASDPRMHLVYYSPSEGPSEEVDFDPQDETEIQQIMLSTLISVEMEAAELLCRILVEYPELPWQMRVQLSRQMWDECRHCVSQRRLLTLLGADLGTWPAITYINKMAGDEPDVLKRLIVLQRVVEGISVDQHRPRARGFLRQGDLGLVQMFDYILADEDTHIALSKWIPIVAGNDTARLQELASFQARKEQEYADYSAWLITKRRDLSRLFPPTATAAPQRGRDQ